MNVNLSSLLAGRDHVPVPNRPGWTLRLLSAAEVLDARREAAELAGDAKEHALCSNACLLARAIELRGKPVFPSGSAALAELRLEEIQALCKQWADFNQAENPSPTDGPERIDALKKAWSTRLMSALNGACSKRFTSSPAPIRRGI